MRLVFLNNCIFFLLISCSNTDKINSWDKDIDRLILDYEKDLTVLESKILNGEDLEARVTFFISSDKKLKKMKYEANHLSFDVINSELYLFNDKLILSKTKYKGPFINKGIREKNTPIGSISAIKIYFKSEYDVLKFEKEMAVYDSITLFTGDKKFDKIAYTPIELNDSVIAVNSYYSSLEFYEEMKNKTP